MGKLRLVIPKTEEEPEDKYDDYYKADEIMSDENDNVEK